ncbi:MAG: DUF3300 domain-containing protein [Pirellulaceae bacterium]
MNWRPCFTPFTVLTLVVGTVAIAQQPNPVGSPSSSQLVPALSPQALDALVAGIAFYPDSVIELILDAAQDPAGIRQAAEGKPGEYRASIRALAQYPELLTQLNQHLALTARLGVAAHTQLPDVWAAIDRVRAQAAAQANASDGSGNEAAAGGTTSTSSAGYYPVPVRPLRGFAAGLLADDVVDELRSVYYSNGVTTVTAGAGQTTVTGPNGTTAVVTGGGVAATTTQGNTTYFGAGGATNVQTSNGANVSAAGGVQGSLTTSDNGASLSKQSAAGVVNNNTGAYAAGTRSTDLQVQQSADGSQSFSRSASTTTQSSVGSTQVDRSASGSVSADGSRSYQSSTDIQSSHGNVSVDTTASQGTVTTTVDSARGQNTYTAGDGEIQHAPSSSGQTSSSAARTTSSATESSRFNSEQIQHGNQAMTQSWGRLEQQAKGSGTAATNRTQTFQRPSGMGAGAGTGARGMDGGRVQPSFSQPAFGSPGGQRGGAPGRSGGGGRRR